MKVFVKSRRWLMFGAAGFVVVLTSQNCSPLRSGLQTSSLSSVTTAAPLPVAPTLDAPSPLKSPVQQTEAQVNSVLRLARVMDFTGYADCWSLGRGNLTEVTYNYKEIYAPGLGKRIRLRAYVSYPPNYNPNVSLPAIAFFHGGGWEKGSPTYWLPMAHYFAARNMIAISFQYRIKSLHKSDVSESIADAKSAIRWMRKFSSQLGIDPNQIVASGDSAGGHLALTTALLDQYDEESGADRAISSRPSAAASLYPVVDATLAGLLPAMSPKHQLNQSNVLPMLIVQGDADTHDWTPPAAAAAFCNSANGLRSGVCTFVSVPNANHSFLDRHDFFVAGIAAIDRFLLERLPGSKYSGDPSQVGAWIAGAADWCHYEDGFTASQFHYGYSSTPFGVF